eukprot:scaffold161412_cov40-Cyclotella_meneghiniana.AAC.1
MLSFVASTAVAKSSMYSSVPAIWSVGSLTSASRALPNFISDGRIVVFGISVFIGESISDGIHSGQCIRSFARSDVMSEPTEKWAGAGEDPNGSLVSKTPMS